MKQVLSNFTIDSMTYPEPSFGIDHALYTLTILLSSYIIKVSALIQYSVTELRIDIHKAIQPLAKKEANE